MTDNVQLNQNTSGGSRIATTVDSGELHHQRVILEGEDTTGEPVGVSATPYGQLEVELPMHRLPFGSLHTESLTPVIQADAVYGVNSFLNNATTGLAVGTGSGSGSVTGTNNVFKASTGTTQYSFATLQSRRRLRYRPGQGLIGRFAGLFSTPAASSIVVAGFGTAESGYFFGYNGTSFGVLKSTGGLREYHTLTITTPSTATNNYVITLPSTATVSIAATNNSNATQTAHEISLGDFPGWSAEARGNTVVFLANSAGSVAGSITLSQPGAATPAAATTAETTAGAAATDTWVPQASWNGDRLDGTGPSGVTLDPAKGNVYQVGMQYLGFGIVMMQIEVSTAAAGTRFVTVHTFHNPNTLTAPHQTQPSFPFTMAAYSAGSTTDVSVSVGSYAGFIEGHAVNIGPRMSYGVTAAVTSSTSAYTPLFTARNSLIFNGRPNQSVAKLISVHGAAKSTNGLTTFYLIRNATLSAGTVNFTQFDTASSTYWDKGATACTLGSDSRVIWSGITAESDSFNFSFADHEITLQPGETVTLAVRSVTATATCVGGLNTREDQ